MIEFKIVTKDDKRGVWLNERDYIDMMLIFYERNKGLYNKFKKDYEFLTQEEFKEEWIRRKKK